MQTRNSSGPSIEPCKLWLMTNLIPDHWELPFDIGYSESFEKGYKDFLIFQQSPVCKLILCLRLYEMLLICPRNLHILHEIIYDQSIMDNW